LAADNSFLLFPVDIPFMRTADHKLAGAESLIKSLKIFVLLQRSGRDLNV
jgi:hypothetical protein